MGLLTNRIYRALSCHGPSFRPILKSGTNVRYHSTFQISPIFSSSWTTITFPKSELCHFSPIWLFGSEFHQFVIFYDPTDLLRGFIDPTDLYDTWLIYFRPSSYLLQRDPPGIFYISNPPNWSFVQPGAASICVDILQLRALKSGDLYI